jgi:hypothetical protein
MTLSPTRALRFAQSSSAADDAVRLLLVVRRDSAAGFEPRRCLCLEATARHASVRASHRRCLARARRERGANSGHRGCESPQDTAAPLLHRRVDDFIQLPYGRMIMYWWTKSPPIMQRTLADDLKRVLFVLTGAMLGYLVFGGGDTSFLLGSVFGAVSMIVVIVVFHVLRRVRRRRSA